MNHHINIKKNKWGSVAPPHLYNIPPEREKISRSPLPTLILLPLFSYERPEIITLTTSTVHTIFAL